MQDTPPAKTSTVLERQVATNLWPEHAEMCSEEDWTIISSAVEENRPLEGDVLEPIGESKDAILASLMILYWTMKVANLAIRISKEVSGLHGRDRAKAIVASLSNTIDPNTPKMVSDQIHQIVDGLGLSD
jgi:hypothetical protein